MIINASKDTRVHSLVKVLPQRKGRSHVPRNTTPVAGHQVVENSYFSMFQRSTQLDRGSREPAVKGDFDSYG